MLPDQSTKVDKKKHNRVKIMEKNKTCQPIREADKPTAKPILGYLATKPRGNFSLSHIIRP